MAVHAYHDAKAIEDKLKHIQYLKSLELQAYGRSSNANHVRKLPQFSPGAEILATMFNLQHKQITQKIEPLPKCSTKMLEERKRGPFVEGGIFLVTSDRDHLVCLN